MQILIVQVYVLPVCSVSSLSVSFYLSCFWYCLATVKFLTSLSFVLLSVALLDHWKWVFDNRELRYISLYTHYFEKLTLQRRIHWQILISIIYQLAMIRCLEPLKVLQILAVNSWILKSSRVCSNQDDMRWAFLGFINL